MDDNVVFNSPNQNSQEVQEGQADTAEPSAGDGSVVTDQTAADDQSAPGENAETGTEEYAEETPQGPLGGILGNGLVKKILIGLGVFIFILVVIFLLIPKGSPTKQVSLQWWGLWEDNSTMQAIIMGFEKTHPAITVTYIKNDPNQYYARLAGHLQDGTGPDIFLFHNTWLPMLTGLLSPLTTTVITPDQFKQEFYPVMQTDLSQNGAIYGLPMDGDSLEMFVNPALLEAGGVQVPTNWNDFVTDAKQLTVKDTTGKILKAGAALGTYDNINHAPDIISMLFLQQGVQMNNFSSSSKAEAGALQFYTSFAQGQNNVWDNTLDNSELAFSKGNLAMYFGFSWDIFAIQRLNPNLNFKIYPVPNLYGNQTTVASYWVNGVSAKSPNQQAAMEFMQYLAQKSTAQLFYSETAKTRAFGEPYARMDLASSLQSNPLVYPFVSRLNDAGSSYFASDTEDGDTGINTTLNTYLQAAVSSVDSDNGSAASAVNDLDNGVNQVLQKYGVQPH